MRFSSPSFTFTLMFVSTQLVHTSLKNTRVTKISPNGRRRQQQQQQQQVNARIVTLRFVARQSTAQLHGVFVAADEAQKRRRFMEQHAVTGSANGCHNCTSRARKTLQRGWSTGEALQRLGR
jgi:hypothetical protein